MFVLKLDTRDFEKQANNMRNAAQDQIPYALALALNTAAENTRNLLINEWPTRVHVRSPGFIRYSLRRGAAATKNNLRIEIYDQTGKAFMSRLETGGTHAARGSNLAIPVEANVRIGSHGVRKSQLPRNLSNAVLLNKNGRPAIYQRVGKGKKKKLKLMYLLRPAVQVPSKMPFHMDFEISMRNEVRTSFPAAMVRAMRTRR